MSKAVARADRTVQGDIRQGHGAPAGYKRSAVGLIPEDWQVVTIGSVANVARGASPRPIDDPVWFDERSETGWLRISDVTAAGKYLQATSQRLSAAGVSNSRFVESGSLVMSICATVGRPIITRMNVCIHDGFVVFEELTTSKEFMYYVLSDLEPDWSKHGQTGSQMNLNTGLIDSTLISLPPLREQRAIAEALSDLDRMLEALDTLVAKKRAIKQASMRQLVTGETRIPGFRGVWSDKPLEDLASITMGQSPPSGFYNNRDEGIPLIQGNADIEGRKTLDRVWTTRSSKRCDAGDLLLTVRAPVGVVAVATKESCLGRGVCGLKPFSDSQFLFHALVCAESRWLAVEQGSTFTAANSEQVGRFTLRVPENESEERAIAEILCDMDGEIAALELRRQKIRTLKHGTMQQLLTGRIRLANPDSLTQSNRE